MRSARVWDRTPASLLVGLEQEHFVLAGGRAPSIGEIEAALEALADAGFAPVPGADPGAPVMRREVRAGYIEVDNDFCTHVLEAAFPPVADPDELEALYRETWSAIAWALAEQGLAVRPGAALVPPCFEPVLVAHPRRDWYARRARPTAERRWWTAYFTTLVCSTQLHLNVHDAAIYADLPRLYELEYLAPLAFSNSPALLGTAAHCCRPLLWHDNRPDEYPAWGIPPAVPASPDAYAAMIAACRDFSRDFSFIAPRDFGTLEFRGACAQPAIEPIVELAALRIGAVLASEHARGREPDRGAADHFDAVCRTGRADPARLHRDLADLARAGDDVPRPWRAAYARMLGRLERAGRA